MAGIPQPIPVIAEAAVAAVPSAAPKVALNAEVKVPDAQWVKKYAAATIEAAFPQWLAQNESVLAIALSALLSGVATIFLFCAASAC